VLSVAADAIPDACWYVRRGDSAVKINCTVLLTWTLRIAAHCFGHC
jgi:hypothetical protein